MIYWYGIIVSNGHRCRHPRCTRCECISGVLHSEEFGLRPLNTLTCPSSCINELSRSRFWRLQYWNRDYQAGKLRSWPWTSAGWRSQHETAHQRHCQNLFLSFATALPDSSSSWIRKWPLCCEVIIRRYWYQNPVAQDASRRTMGANAFKDKKAVLSQGKRAMPPLLSLV